MRDRFCLRYVYNNKIYDVFAVLFSFSAAHLVSFGRAETLFMKIETDKLIQCTGKKDKTGKLIFEGDIVREYDQYGYVKTKVVVFLEDVMFGFNINVEFDYEIIGNIYENPELLGETNDKI